MPCSLVDRHQTTGRQIPEERIWELWKIYESERAKRDVHFSLLWAPKSSISFSSTFSFPDCPWLSLALSFLTFYQWKLRCDWKWIARHPHVINLFFNLKLRLYLYSELYKLPASTINSLQLLKLTFCLKYILLSISSRGRNGRLIIRCIQIYVLRRIRNLNKLYTLTTSVYTQASSRWV
jgi:hypothetical protein